MIWSGEHLINYQTCRDFTSELKVLGAFYRSKLCLHFGILKNIDGEAVKWFGVVDDENKILVDAAMIYFFFNNCQKIFVADFSSCDNMQHVFKAW